MIRKISKRRSAAGEVYSIKRSRPKPKKRSAKERLRIYGPKGYVEWIHEQPCIACGVVGFSECAHIKTGGTGRKSDWTETVPLCRGHFVHDEETTSFTIGCHVLFHHQGQQYFEARFRIDLEKLAAETQAAWLEFSGGSHHGR